MTLAAIQEVQIEWEHKDYHSPTSLFASSDSDLATSGQDLITPLCFSILFLKFSFVTLAQFQELYYSIDRLKLSSKSKV